MELIVVAILALVAGVAVGSVLGARRALALIVAGHRVRSGPVPSFMPQTMPARNATDILAGRVRITLGSTEYVLATLPRGPARRWMEQLDARFASLAASLDAAGTDAPIALSLLVAQADAMYDMLVSYDVEHVLPDRDDETMTDAQILHAVLEVWRAVHPLVAGVASGPDEPPTSTSFVRPSTPPMPTDGAPVSSSAR